MTTVRAARARNGARNRGFSRTRSNTAVGSNRTRTRSRTAPITTSRTKGSPSRTAGTAPNIRDSMVAASGGSPLRKADPERAERARSEGSALVTSPGLTGLHWGLWWERNEKKDGGGCVGATSPNLHNLQNLQNLQNLPNLLFATSLTCFRMEARG